MFSLVLLFGTSCTPGSPAIAARSYARSCTSDVDCFPVAEGPVTCCGLGCASTAIRQDQMGKFTMDLAREIADACAAYAELPTCPALACKLIPAACAHGVCELAAGSPDGGKP